MPAATYQRAPIAMNDPQQEKQTLRERMRGLMRGMEAAQRREQSSALCRQLRLQPLYLNASQILFYAPMPDEMDVWQLFEEALARGVEVFLPRYDVATKAYHAARIVDLERDVAVGRFGIREPSARCVTYPSKRLDLMLVPGLAFDRNGNRLGRGQGFYDRLLSDIQGSSCGIAFDFQLVEAVPVEQQDIRLNHIMTPTSLLTFR